MYSNNRGKTWVFYDMEEISFFLPFWEIIEETKNGTKSSSNVLKIIVFIIDDDYNSPLSSTVMIII